MKPYLQTVVLSLLLVFTAACTPSVPEEPQKITGPEDVSFSSDDPIWGNKNAPIQMTVFSDFQCPYCAEFYISLKKLEPDWIKTGKLAIQYRDFPLAMHQNAMVAHMATDAALMQNAYWEYHERLYKDQNIWSTQEDPEDYMKALAAELKLNASKFEVDMNSKDLEKEIFDDRDLGRQIGVTGTPGFVINGQLFRGAYTIDELEKELKFFEKSPSQ